MSITSEIHIRPAIGADAVRLHALDSATSANPMATSRYQRICSASEAPGEWALVLDRQGKICGFILMALVLDEASVHNIAVTPAARGQGLGRLLLQAALDKAAGDGASRCLLEVRESNQAAINLYQRAGFVEDGRRRAYYPCPGGREDALLMSMQLRDSE